MSKKNELAYRIWGDGRTVIEAEGLPVVRLPIPCRLGLGEERRMHLGVSFDCPVLVHPSPMLKSYSVSLKEPGKLFMPDEEIFVTLVTEDPHVDLDDGMPVAFVVPIVRAYDVLVRRG
jgi:hypothetical protein